MIAEILSVDIWKIEKQFVALSLMVLEANYVFFGACYTNQCILTAVCCSVVMIISSIGLGRI